MEHVTACYWQREAEAGLFLSLQQRNYRRRKASVVSACISDNREQMLQLQNRMEEALETEAIWKPHREALLQEKWEDYLETQKEDGDYAGILCVENRVLLFGHGRMRICGIFHRFGRAEWKIFQKQCMAGEVETGTALLVADNAFVNCCEGELAECLQPQNLWGLSPQERGRRATKRLQELGSRAERQGGRHMGAVWILPEQGV